MPDTATDIRTLIRANEVRFDSVAVSHVVSATLFLALGAAAAGVAFLAMAFPSFVPLGYGVFRAVTMLALVAGFGTLAVVGGAYYVLPRLTGAPLWNEGLARLGLVLVAGSTVAGMIAVALGLGDGREPFGLPWWLDAPLLVGLAIPPLVAARTLSARVENRSFVTVPLVVTGLGALPLLYLAGNVPGTAAASAVLGDLFLSAGYVGALLLASFGLVLFAVVKHDDRPLSGRPLAQVGFWSLLFSMGWYGVAQLAGGPHPIWLGAIGAVLGLAFPVGCVAIATAVYSTARGGWQGQHGPDPVVAAAVAGASMAVVASILAAAAGFGASSRLLALTVYWEGINYALVLGVMPLLTAGWMFQALPRMTGRRLFSIDRANRAIRLLVTGSGATLALLVVAGLVAGFSWAGSAFTGAFTATGNDWSAASGPAAVFTGLGAVAGLVAAAGALLLASLTLRTLTQGAATTQDVLVTASPEAPDHE